MYLFELINVLLLCSQVQNHPPGNGISTCFYVFISRTIFIYIFIHVAFPQQILKEALAPAEGPIVLTVQKGHSMRVHIYVTYRTESQWCNFNERRRKIKPFKTLCLIKMPRPHTSDLLILLEEE